MHPQPGLLRRYFSGLAEHTFHVRLGVTDPPLVEYLADMLARFVRSDVIYKMRNTAGRRLEEVAEMLVESEERVGNARREVHRHIGDYTLFWTGVYPEALKHMRESSRKDHLIDYFAQGKRAYLIASTIETDEQESASGDVLERLSHQFELCAYGLREVRRLWELRDDGQDLAQAFLIN